MHTTETNTELTSRVSELHADVCRALGSAARIEILYSLRDGEEKSVNELTETLGLRQANVSQHLAVLRQKKVVVTRREGASTYYRISSPKIIQACELMREVLLEQLKEDQELTRLVGQGRGKRFGRR